MDFLTPLAPELLTKYNASGIVYTQHLPAHCAHLRALVKEFACSHALCLPKYLLHKASGQARHVAFLQKRDREPSLHTMQPTLA